jgi:hypothetical protein
MLWHRQLEMVMIAFGNFPLMVDYNGDHLLWLHCHKDSQSECEMGCRPCLTSWRVFGIQLKGRSPQVAGGGTWLRWSADAHIGEKG